jgi:hypothetical protein
MKVLQAKYDSLAAHPEFRRLKSRVPLYATWDDHDYGWNDAGKYYPFREESKKIFLKFFGEPPGSERYKHEGIYHSELFEGQGRRVQLILLDVRTFRSDLRIYRGEFAQDDKFFYPLDYHPHQIADSTLLLTTAELLANGVRFPLGRYLLSSTYHLLHQVSQKLLLGEPIGNLGGPWWFINMWLNAHMHKRLQWDFFA